MADQSQFDTSSPIACAECEARLTDLVDEKLSDSERLPVETHVAGCENCRTTLEEVRRGQAWLRLLRDDDVYLEPPAGLVDRILAATEPGASALSSTTAEKTKDEPWSNVSLPAVRHASWYQPRIMLTAAMAFFSLTLTMSVAGIRPVDLKPSNIRHTITRQYFQANAHVVRYYENLRVVYELESRVRQLQRATESSGSTNTQQPQTKPRTKSGNNGSSSGRPANDPGIAHGDDKAVPEGDLLIAGFDTNPTQPIFTEERSRV